MPRTANSGRRIARSAGEQPAIRLADIRIAKCGLTQMRIDPKADGEPTFTQPASSSRRGAEKAPAAMAGRRPCAVSGGVRRYAGPSVWFMGRQFGATLWAGRVNLCEIV